MNHPPDLYSRQPHALWPWQCLWRGHNQDSCNRWGEIGLLERQRETVPRLIVIQLSVKGLTSYLKGNVWDVVWTLNSSSIQMELEVPRFEDIFQDSDAEDEEPERWEGFRGFRYTLHHLKQFFNYLILSCLFFNAPKIPGCSLFFLYYSCFNSCSKKRREDEEEDENSLLPKKERWRRKREELLYTYYELSGGIFWGLRSGFLVVSKHFTIAQMEYAKIFQPFHELGKKLFVTQLHVGFGQTVALTMFNLAWKMSKDNNQSLWWAIIGMTDQLLHHKISRDQYVTCFAQVKGSFTLFIVFTIILSVSYLSVKTSCKILVTSSVITLTRCSSMYRGWITTLTLAMLASTTWSSSTAMNSD